MTPLIVTYVLTVLAAVVVVLTRVRLARGEGDAAGRIVIPRAIVNLHTGAGLPALGLWVAFLVTRVDIVGWVGLAFWWLTVVGGLLILARWLPAHGRHSSGPAADPWGEGPGLSVLAHIGLLVGVLIFTVFLVLGKLP